MPNTQVARPDFHANVAARSELDRKTRFVQNVMQHAIQEMVENDIDPWTALREAQETFSMEEKFSGISFEKENNKVRDFLRLHRLKMALAAKTII